VDGAWKGYADGVLLDDANGTVFFSDQQLNASGFDYLVGGSGAQQGWEDLWMGGDLDFNDIGLNARLQLIQLNPEDADQTVTVTATDKGGLTADASFHLDLTTTHALFDGIQQGTDAADLLIGNGKANALSGGAGDDILIGGSGHDYLVGGAGDDTLHGGFGSNIMIGGDGSDRFVFNALHGLDTVEGGSGGVWTDIIDLSRLSGAASHDWTLVLAQGSVLSQTAQDIVLSADAHGSIQFAGETHIAFHGIETIHL
jgi:Ca2+-binding RTX toxin-like protein